MNFSFQKYLSYLNWQVTDKFLFEVMLTIEMYIHEVPQGGNY
jgi:hypothetical protein